MSQQGGLTDLYQLTYKKDGCDTIRTMKGGRKIDAKCYVQSFNSFKS